MPSTPYKGSLKAKRKNELTEIATALGIGLDASQKKEELEDLIREHLISHKSQYSANDNFKGLIDSLDSGRKRSARSSSVNGNADSDTSDSPESSARSPRKHSQRPSNLGTPLSTAPFNAIPATAADLATTVKQRGLKARKSLDKLVDTISDNARSTASELTSEVQDAQSEVAAGFHAVQGEAADDSREPKTTALIFASGKMVVTGAKSEDDSRLASRKYARIIQKLGFEAKFSEFKIQNIVGSCDVRFPIRLEGLAYSHGVYSSYEPELFPGLIYRMVKPKVVLLIFVSGKIVLTGAKVREEIYQAFNLILPVLAEFRKP